MNIPQKYLFSIPDSEHVRYMNFIFLEIIKFHQDWCYNDFEIETAYGVPGCCIWNGNRESVAPDIGLSDFKGIIRDYSKFHIKYRLTFTNFLLRPEHLGDKYANELASELNEFGGYCMVSLPLTYEYIKKNYPQLVLSWSTTTDFGQSKEEKIAKINELSKNDLVVPPYDLNRTAFSQWEHPNNLEFLINEMCVDNCPKRREHEIASCQYNLGELKDHIGGECLLHRYGIKPIDAHLDGIIGRKKLSEYVNHGFYHFKISGRHSMRQTLVAYLYFMVYPERWMECLLEMQKFGKIFDNQTKKIKQTFDLDEIDNWIRELAMLVHYGGLAR